MNEIREHQSRIPQFERLSSSEEFALIEQWKETGNQKAFDKVYLANAGLVYSLVRLYSQVHVSKEDLIQEGMVGLAESIKAIDTSKGVPLGTYAAQWIKAAMRNYILANHGIVKTATTAAQRKLFFGLRQHLPLEGRLSNADRERLAEKLNVQVSDIRDMEDRFKVTESSVHHTDPGEEFVNDGKEALPLADESEGPEELVFSHIEHEKQKERFKKRLYKLSKQQRELIYKRYLIEDGEKRPTHKEFTESFGVSRERVRQIEAKAFERMKSLFKKEVA